MVDGDRAQLLVVVAKKPMPGEVKTRLLPQLTPAEATHLYSCFLRDRIKEISGLDGIDLAIAYTPADAEAYFTRFLSNGFRLFPQQGGNLGQRLHHIFRQTLHGGYQAVCIIDSDTPDLPRTLVARAFQWLEAGTADVVFGPCTDGGYYLVGLRHAHGELFADIDWSTSRVLSQSLQKAQVLGLRTRLLPQWNDLDTIGDLQAYYRQHGDNGGNPMIGRETFDYLASIDVKTR